MKVILTYDVSGEHNNIKADLLALGYQDYIIGNTSKKKYNLPNTTLYHPNLKIIDTAKPLEHPYKEIKEVLKKYRNIKLIRCILLEVNNRFNFIGIEGEPHTS
jgi:hypothetical protein